MSKIGARNEMVSRRGELLAELFLEELGPEFIARATSRFEYDSLIGIRNSRGGVNNIAVGVKATERSVSERYPIPKRQYDRWAHSNIPILLLVIDVKQNRYHYALLSPEVANGPVDSRVISIPLTAINEFTKNELLGQLAR
jgi:hypothetical protein